MAEISLTCPVCKQTLTFPEDRAGRKAECTRCGEAVMVPQLAPAAAGDGDEDDMSAYGVAETSTEEKKRTIVKKQKKEKKKSAIQKRKKAINEPELWAKTHSGLLFIQIGAYIWAAAFALENLMVLLGCAKGPEYAALRDALMTGEERDLCRFAVGLVSGYDLLGLAMLLLILSCVLLLVKSAVSCIGYGICMGGPPHFGMTGQSVSLLILAIVNATFLSFFKLFPLLGIIPFTLLEVLTPTLPCLEANYERVLPLHVFWSSTPFWDLTLSFFILGCFFFESVLASIYLRCVGMASREELITDAGTGLSQLGMGTMFVLLAYNMLALTGTSEVMVTVLRLIYLLWSGFMILFLVRFIQGVALARRRLGALLEGIDLDALDEDQRRRERKGKKKPARDEVEEDEEEDEDDEEEEDDDDEEEERQRKRKKRK